jgi:hypothetical protein
MCSSKEQTKKLQKSKVPEIIQWKKAFQTSSPAKPEESSQERTSSRLRRGNIKSYTKLNKAEHYEFIRSTFVKGRQLKQNNVLNPPLVQYIVPKFNQKGVVKKDI